MGAELFLSRTNMVHLPYSCETEQFYTDLCNKKKHGSQYQKSASVMAVFGWCSG
jgi:hypothetical protein